MFRYPLTIFLSAFLLFQVQPLVGKMILPWFGGTPAVWTSCMLFFQMLLLGGYAYAHFVTQRLPAMVLAVVHGGLLLASLLYLPVTAAESWKPQGSEPPVLQILGLLVLTVGLPYFLLSTTGPLLQESFRRETGRPPYRLYSLSNIGSLLALLTYPIVFEPQLTLRLQSITWSLGYAAFVAFGLWSTVALARLPRRDAESVDLETGESPVAEGAAASNLAAAPIPTTAPTLGLLLLWLALAACGSLLLLATTNQLCLEMTSVPFLWVLPLSIYLLTFIITFNNERWYHRGIMVSLQAVAVLLGCYALVQGHGLPAVPQMVIYSSVLFVFCMVCHGELAQSKPAPQYATLFYLTVSAGGALGGVLVAIVAPLIFSSGYWEYPVGLLAAVLLTFIASQMQPESKLNLPRPVYFIGGAIVIVLSLATGVIMGRKGSDAHGTLETSRNFYGVLRVEREESVSHDHGPYNVLVHGTIQHGTQLLDLEKRSWPTTYYGHNSGVGLAIDRHPRRSAENTADRALRIGVVGLGTGTLAAYGQKGDALRFYEINSEVIRLSDKYFTYRRDTPAEVDVILGDARLSLERERAEDDPLKYDILVIDAFSSDSIPMHLLTKESVELYLDRLQPDGILAIHTSNRFLDLSSVVLGIAQELNWPCVLIESSGNHHKAVNQSQWILMTQNWEFLNDEEIRKVSTPSWPESGKPIVWTDDYGSLWHVISD